MSRDRPSRESTRNRSFSLLTVITRIIHPALDFTSQDWFLNANTYADFAQVLNFPRGLQDDLLNALKKVPSNGLRGLANA
ncbi:MAG: hypothetical protein Q9160_002059 [Pyrenula sp. 1 TL-2023]